ncbi:site-specific integrase [Angustibacter luteus]|uniref:Site-specific integrase n=1 Tax=Angustibacter luteus TaxID=658456 RepID=A0ABW1JE53_9ACTN
MSCLYELLIVTGLRRGEAVGLRWDAVGVNCMSVMVVQQIVDVGGHLTIGTPKTKRGVRGVALDIETARRLREHRIANQLEREAAGPVWKEHGLVFTQPDGRPLRPEFVTKHFKVLAKRAGLPTIRLHDLRHTNASLALQAGVPLKVVSDRLGHSQTAITADLYTHVSPVVGQEAADQIAAVLPRGRSRGAEVSEKLAPSGRTAGAAEAHNGGTNKAPDRVSAGQGPDP